MKNRKKKEIQKAGTARESHLGIGSPSIKPLESPCSFSDSFYSNLWQSWPEIPPTVSSFWLISILYIKANEVLECDSITPPFVFFLVPRREHLQWSRILWIAVEKKVGDICISVMSWGQEKRGTKTRDTSRERWEGQKRERAKANYARLKLSLELAMCAEMWLNLSSHTFYSIFSILLLTAWPNAHREPELELHSYSYNSPTLPMSSLDVCGLASMASHHTYIKSTFVCTVCKALIIVPPTLHF